MARIIDSEKKNLIGANLKKLRRKLGVSQQTLSNKLELLGVYVCRGSISRIEDFSLIGNWLLTRTEALAIWNRGKD